MYFACFYYMYNFEGYLQGTNKKICDTLNQMNIYGAVRTAHLWRVNTDNYKIFGLQFLIVQII